MASNLHACYIQYVYHTSLYGDERQYRNSNHVHASRFTRVQASWTRTQHQLHMQGRWRPRSLTTSVMSSPFYSRKKSTRAFRSSQHPLRKTPLKILNCFDFSSITFIKCLYANGCQKYTNQYFHFLSVGPTYHQLCYSLPSDPATTIIFLDINHVSVQTDHPTQTYEVPFLQSYTTIIEHHLQSLNMRSLLEEPCFQVKALLIHLPVIFMMVYERYQKNVREDRAMTDLRRVMSNSSAILGQEEILAHSLVPTLLTPLPGFDTSTQGARRRFMRWSFK